MAVPRLGLGLAALGRPGYINIGRAAELAELGAERSPEAMERRCHAVLDAAYAAGVRYFDAARSYGESERFLASWLAARALTRDDVVVGSKVNTPARASPLARIHALSLPPPSLPLPAPG